MMGLLFARQVRCIFSMLGRYCVVSCFVFFEPPRSNSLHIMWKFVSNFFKHVHCGLTDALCYERTGLCGGAHSSSASTNEDSHATFIAQPGRYPGLVLITDQSR